MCVVAEHVQAGAGRRQQHHIARLRSLIGQAGGILPAYPPAALAHSRRPGFSAIRSASRPINSTARGNAAPRPARGENPGPCCRRRQSAPPAWHAIQRGRWLDIGAFGIVAVKVHALMLQDMLHPMRQPLERAQAVQQRRARQAFARTRPAPPARWRYFCRPVSSHAGKSSTGSPSTASHKSPRHRGAGQRPARSAQSDGRRDPGRAMARQNTSSRLSTCTPSPAKSLSCCARNPANPDNGRGGLRRYSAPWRRRRAGCARLQLKAGQLQHKRHPARRRCLRWHSASSTGRPILPATTVFSPACWHKCPTSEVTVVLLFEPVMAITLFSSPAMARANNSTSPITWPPAWANAARQFRRRGQGHARADHQQMAAGKAVDGEWAGAQLGLGASVAPARPDAAAPCGCQSPPAARRAASQRSADRPLSPGPTTPMVVRANLHRLLLSYRSFSVDRPPAPASW